MLSCGGIALKGGRGGTPENALVIVAMSRLMARTPPTTSDTRNVHYHIGGPSNS